MTRHWTARLDPIHQPHESWLDRLTRTQARAVGALIVGACALAGVTLLAMAAVWL